MLFLLGKQVPAQNPTKATFTARHSPCGFIFDFSENTLVIKQNLYYNNSHTKRAKRRNYTPKDKII
jgi:hypothetical protein